MVDAIHVLEPAVGRRARVASSPPIRTGFCFSFTKSMGFIISGKKASARCGAAMRGAGVVRGTGRGSKGGKKRRTARLLYAHGPDDSSNGTCKKEWTLAIVAYKRFGEGCRDAVEPNNALQAKNA